MLTRKLSRTLGLCAALLAARALTAQNGPDNDPDAAPGYTNSVFQHDEFDSINLYNGQLTIPIALGPSYPIGPKLRLQLTLVYDSRVDDYGAPLPGQQQSTFVYMPLTGNPSLPIGFELSLGAVKQCKHGGQTSPCYVAPDGGQHLFTRASGNGRVTTDGTSFFLKGSGPYDMWDGDGNHYVFDQQASGFDDVNGQGFTHDFGRGRDGWYLRSLTDPFGNGYSVTYWTGGHSQWTYGTDTCPAWGPVMRMKTPAGTGGWVPKDITLPSGQLVRVDRGNNGYLDGMVVSVTAPVFAGGTLSNRVWKLVYDAPYTDYAHSCGSGALFVNLQRLKEVQLPSDLTGAPRYQFVQESRLEKLTLPAGASAEYCWGGYTFFHGRAGAVTANCPGLRPPAGAGTEVTPNAVACGVPAEQPPAPQISANCTEDNEARWMDRQVGVLKRTVTEPVRGKVSTTTYTQYAFPFGETGSEATPQEPQTLTVVVYPPSDQNESGSAGRARAQATLFLSSPKIFQGHAAPSVPGDRVGADVEQRLFEADPNDVAPGSPACPGTAADEPFCSSRSLRTVRRGFEYDDPTDLEGNRRLASEKTIYGAGTCAGCLFHLVAWSNSFGTWEANGRHYENETHSGSLGDDSRSIFTDWTPVNWPGGPPAGGIVLPNLFVERRTTQGAAAREDLFEFDDATGFLKGSLVYDADRDLAFLKCRYPDADGSVDREFSKTFSSSTMPAATYCSDHYAAFPSPVGLDGDMFGKDYSWQNGELLSARWINGSTATPTFPTRRYARDATTGWVLSSDDTAGLTTRYVYDSLGRVTQITPPAAGEHRTFVCYEGPNATTAYRAAASQACPVGSGNPSVKTWEHYDYDGLGRWTRQKRVAPGAGVSKRFRLFDPAGNENFLSEWIADAAAESITADYATACVFSNGSFPTRRPSSAPGTYRMCFDPLGRPQQIVGSRHSGLHTVDRRDGAAWYSPTLESTLTYCVNATFADPRAATCSSGGLNAARATRRDASGRVTSVIEPSGDASSYAWDLNGKLTKVTQGAQVRSFAYDAAGLLRSETTPEGGTVTFDAIGSLGNVLRETRPGNLIATRKFDFAGRPTREDAGGLLYSVQCYDGSGACADGSPNFAGGANPGGRLTRRYGFNYIPTAGPVVDETFEYGDPGGRLSKVTTAAGNGDLSASAAQSWTYDALGNVASRSHPRTAGAPAFPESATYAYGLPTSLAANGTAVVPSASYGASGALASWTAGNSGVPVVTTIAPDASLLPRPASISNSLWSSGAYTYDTIGDILKTGSTDSFSYDSRARLVSATLGSASRAFAYDRWGNLTGNGTQAFSIDPLHNRITSGGAQYDARGNMTGWGGETMSYDLLDRQYRNSSAAADWVYLFAGSGERTAKFPAKSPVLRREMARYIAEANVLAKGWALPACAAVFTDVPCTDPDARHIKLAYDKGITGGCNTNPLQYCPDAALTRAQMAVFLVKGYKPDGFAPPPCQGTFPDVACGGPYAGFAPWIEQLYRDGVTAGCSASPLQFCPGAGVGEWEMLVWLAKAPGAAPGSAFWAAYRPVPRGTIYTFRDDSNRVVTEMSGGSGGASSATLSVTRDNVFLGNLLVASYVASPAGWQYTTSDHLGTPRLIFNQSGQPVETHKYWPYGEDTAGTPPTQRLAYALMERDTEAPRFYDHARNHDTGLGRFLSPDRVGGTPADPQSWNRYAYTLNNPMKHVDPDGNVAVGFTGMGNSPLSGVHGVAEQFRRHLFMGPTRVFRHQDVSQAYTYVMAQLKLDRDQPVAIFGHSRGAAASLKLARMLQAAGVRVDLLLTIDPVMMDPAASQRVPSNVKLAINYWENISSPLEGLYLTGDSDGTVIENRQVGTGHGTIDDLVARAAVEFDQIISRVSEMLRESRDNKKREICEEMHRPCASH